HSRVNQELEDLARSEGIRLQSSMTTEHREEATKLMSKQGADFDAAYIQAMVEGHEKAVEAFSAQADQNKTDVDRWAASKRAGGGGKSGSGGVSQGKGGGGETPPAGGGGAARRVRPRGEGRAG